LARAVKNRLLADNAARKALNYKSVLLFVASALLQLDFHVDAGWEIQFHQGVNSLLRGVHDVHQTLMGPQLELVTGRFVDVRTAQDVKTTEPGG
jgi:hypothetical protein